MTFFEKVGWKLRHYYTKCRSYYFKNREKFVIPPYEEKRAIILGYKNQYGLETFIETGTFFGDTIDQFKNNFRTLVSFELSKELADKAKARFSRQLNVTIIEGDSGKLLAPHLADVKEPCLFWLDGHYSSEFYVGDEYIVTAKGDKNTPVMEELKSILSHPVQGHVILIDDARCFTGKADYPEIPAIKKLIDQSGKDLSLKVKRDIIRIAPAKKTT
jgi:hypothetical protein